ncbi:MAG TPA: hypothetical protein VLS94_10205, partial [Fusibacter sp.]|nr:hypothetical protein [Fusibacter sp.]
YRSLSGVNEKNADALFFREQEDLRFSHESLSFVQFIFDPFPDTCGKIHICNRTKKEETKQDDTALINSKKRLENRKDRNQLQWYSNAEPDRKKQEWFPHIIHPFVCQFSF